MEIGKKIKKESKTLIERGISSDSYFYAKFTDGSERKEHDTNWSDFSEKKEVEFMGRKKIVYVSKHSVKELTIKHGNLETTIEVDTGEEVYQSIVSSSFLRNDSIVEHKILGRKVGKIKDGKVIEERFIDGRTGEIIGMKF